MSESLDYHKRLDGGTVLSLQFVHPEREKVKDRERELRECAEENGAKDFKSRIQSQTFDEKFHAVYSAEIYPREFPDEDIESLSQRESLIIDSLLDAFRSFEKECKEEGGELKWYKQPDVGCIVEEASQTQWQQPVPEVAGSLLSNLIFAHGLPNANHRSSLSFVETYISTFEPDFEIPDTGVQGEWFDWSKKFVHESKRLLMLARKSPMFRYIDEWGCSHIRRKNDVVVDFDEYDIWVDDPWSHFRGQHQELSIEFVHRILEQTKYNKLIGKQDPGKRVFLDRVSGN